MSGRLPQRRLDGWGLSAALLATAFAFAISPAQACTIQLGPISGQSIVYDPFVAPGTEGQIRVSVDLVEGEDCSATVLLTEDSGAPLRTLDFGFGQPVRFRPRLRPGPDLRESTDPALAEVALSQARTHAEITWTLTPDTEALLAPGEYTARVKAQLSAPGQPISVSTGQVALRSIARAQMNLAGAAGGYEAGGDSATIDLGELVTGATGRAFLQLRANTPAKLSFRSQSHGNLVNMITNARIPYQLSFDGTQVPLEQDSMMVVDTPSTLRGSTSDLVVRVGVVDGALAGRYSDTIVIEISP